MKKTLFFRLITLIMILLNMFFIFRLSAEQASVSRDTSRKVTEKVLEVTVSDFREKPEEVKKSMVKSLDGKIRSLAHFSEYTLLGFLVSLHLSLYKISKIKNAFLALSGCTVYAIIDEIHQTFVPGRSFQFIDILTDFSGILLGIGILASVIFLIKKATKKSAVS